MQCGIKPNLRQPLLIISLFLRWESRKIAVVSKIYFSVPVTFDKTRHQDEQAECLQFLGVKLLENIQFDCHIILEHSKHSRTCPNQTPTNIRIGEGYERERTCSWISRKEYVFSLSHLRERPARGLCSAYSRESHFAGIISYCLFLHTIVSCTRNSDNLYYADIFKPHILTLCSSDTGIQILASPSSKRTFHIHRLAFIANN